MIIFGGPLSHVCSNQSFFFFMMYLKFLPKKIDMANMFAQISPLFFADVSEVSTKKIESHASKPVT